MKIGDRIKRIRTMRGMTQKELGLAVGFPTRSADVRIADLLHFPPKLRQPFFCSVDIFT